MRFIKYFLLVATLLGSMINITMAQSGFETYMQTLTDNTGITEGELRERLIAEGIDVETLSEADLNDPGLQNQVKLIIQQMIREKEEAKSKPTEITELPAEGLGTQISSEVQEAIDEGASVEEAVSEGIAEVITSDEPSPIFGQEIFRDKSIGVYTQSDDIKAPNNYILGSGDIVNVSIWGRSQFEQSYTLDNAGFITPNNMPRINLKGLTYRQAKDVVRNRFSRFYRFNQEEFELTLKYSRVITVSIFGEAVNRGSFSLPATNSIYNALVAAGGPTAFGTIRNIQLIRGDEIERIDVYEFIFNRSSSKNIFLEEGDNIHIPFAEKVVEISGAVRKPYKYELLENENLIKLLEYCGGLTENAYTKVIQIQRFEDNQQKIIDVNLDDLMNTRADFRLKGGDVVTIRMIPTEARNLVTINGAVVLSGEFELKPNMKVSDLVDLGMLRKGARKDIATLERNNFDGTKHREILDLENILANRAHPENLLLKPDDVLNILSKKTYTDAAVFTVGGAVRNPGDFAFDPREQTTVADALLLAGDLKPEATEFAYIYRVDKNEPGELEYILINLNEVKADPSSDKNITLRPFDRLYIYSKATFIDEAKVNVMGAVRNPGEFKYDASLSLQELITMSGGLKFNASSNRIDISRLVFTEDAPTRTVVATVSVDRNQSILDVVDDFPIWPFDMIIVRQVPDFKFQRIVQIQGEVMYPGSYAISSDNERVSSIIERAGGLTPRAFIEGSTLYRAKDGIGYVVVRFDEVLKTQYTHLDLVVKEGDIIRIPDAREIITISGSTNVHELYPEKIIGNNGKINVAFTGKRQARFYINEFAAGVSENGSYNHMVVQYPNGELKKTRRFLFLKFLPKIEPGCDIVVGSKPKKEPKQKTTVTPEGDVITETVPEPDKEPVDWNKVLQDTVAQAVSVLTLLLLIQRLD